MKKNLLLLIFILPFFVHAQQTEDFSDGNFTSNPTWSGDVSQFTVNASFQLQLNSSGTNVSYLSAANVLATLDSTEWSCYIRQNFSPSASNYGRVYLTSDQANLEGPLNGYYLQFGEALSNDAVELFCQTGSTSTSVCRGTNAQIANSFALGVRVTRSSSGLWSLYVDAGGGTNYLFEASGSNTTFNSSSFFGVVCSYTTSNATNFYFDNFFVGPIIADIIPPAISSVNVMSSTELDVKFSESVDQTTAQATTNYFVTNGIGNPSAAQRDLSDLSLVHLTFATSFANAVLDTITINNVTDPSNNVIAANSKATFTYLIPVTPSPFDVLINELMPDPDPVVANFPGTAEYVELFNNSSKVFNLSGWTFSDASTTVTFGSQTLAPHSYLIICSSSFQPAFSVYGTTVGFSSFPSLNNTGGETLTLKDNNGNVIDNMYYDETYYHNTIKSNGGWSIERIDPDFTCLNATNWTASSNSNGGTPGTLNSADGQLTDNTPPHALRALLESASSVRIFFDEPLEASSVSNASFTIDNGIGVPVTAIPSTDLTTVLLTTSVAFDSAHIYTISVSAIKDCPGNTMTAAAVRAAFPKQVDSGDVIINEVLFHPQTGGSEFVELYNSSAKVLNLKDINLYDPAASTPLYSLTSTGFLFFPGDYMAVTKKVPDLNNRYTILNPLALLQVLSMPTYTDVSDVVAIAKSSGSVLDQLNYFENWQLPLLNSFAGVSLERLSASRPTQDQSNWHSAAESAGFATPGYKNSQNDNSLGNGSELSVDPEIFSPDNDGHNDVVNVHYHFDAPGNIANVIVYDSKGRLIRNLVNNELLGNDGSFIWDGITNEKNKARIGMYIFYVEVFDVKGDTKTFKKTCVLASKL